MERRKRGEFSLSFINSNEEVSSLSFTHTHSNQEVSSHSLTHWNQEVSSHSHTHTEIRRWVLTHTHTHKWGGEFSLIHSFKWEGEFTVTHSPTFIYMRKWVYLLVFIYNILGFIRLQWWLSSFPSIRPVIRPVIHSSKFLISEEKDDGRGRRRRMAAAIVYPNVYAIQSCSLWKTLVVLQFANSYKLIF
jgi:hypothetical protein